MPDVYKTMGAISSISMGQCKDKADIEIDFMQGYKAEFKDTDGKDNSEVFGIGQCIELDPKGRIELEHHKIIEKRFTISNDLLLIALHAKETKCLVELTFTVGSPNSVTELKVK